MAFVSVKDFTTGLAAKLSTWLVNTDENVTKHGLVDSANAEVLGKAGDAASTATDGTAAGLTAVFKQISKSLQALVTAFGAALTRGAGTTDANTQRIAIASDSAGIIATGTPGSPASQTITVQGAAGGTPQPVTPGDQYAQYETVAASQTAQAMGATGAAGDYLAGVLVFPGAAGCGVVTILDNATTIGSFAGGGTTQLADLKPFLIPVGLFSTSGAWKITTGANVTAVGIGKFT